MKITSFLSILLCLFLVSCLDPNLPRVNGMWQLKTIRDESGNTQTVDTIYYSFQRQAIFSYLILHPGSDLPYPADMVYGYVDFPEKDKLRIQVDAQYNWETPLSWLLWKEAGITYDILKLNSREMVLGWENKEYNFIKF